MYILRARRSRQKKNKINNLLYKKIGKRSSHDCIWNIWICCHNFCPILEIKITKNVGKSSFQGFLLKK